MPSFAELKAKAAGAATTGKDKFNNVRDRNTSVPMAKTNWDPYSGAPPPPPPPPRSLVNQKTKPVAPPLLPPPSRTSSSATPSLNRNSSVPPALPSRGSSSSSSSSPPPPPRGKGSAPPPPPARSSASAVQHKLPPGPPQPPMSGGPPPIARSTRPGIPTRHVAPEGPEIEWTNLSPEDKQVFFSWLDEFFANFTPPTIVITPDATGAVEHSITPAQGPAPPPLRTATKPRPQPGNQSSTFTLSHPPSTRYGSAALDLAHYFAPATLWTSTWYDATGAESLPPPIVGHTNHMYTSAWRSRGTSKTTQIGIFFSDLSVFWGTIKFTTTNPADQSSVTRSAEYLAPPAPLGRPTLVEAHETYGETIALFAESFVGSGQYCARGECWDLANEALKYFSDYDYISKPVPSISRTHGHLIFEGRASNGGRAMDGRWRGGDDRIRRGDIAEWRTVKIGMAGGRVGGYFTLGDPDHTSIVVDDCIPSSAPQDGASMKPSDLGIIAVVEQSAGHPPDRREYDLSRFEEGEMWIYRPISMQAYLGVDNITAVPPDGLRGLLRL